MPAPTKSQSWTLAIVLAAGVAVGACTPNRSPKETSPKRSEPAPPARQPSQQPLARRAPPSSQRDTTPAAPIEVSSKEPPTPSCFPQPAPPESLLDLIYLRWAAPPGSASSDSPKRLICGLLSTCSECVFST